MRFSILAVVVPLFASVAFAAPVPMQDGLMRRASSKASASVSATASAAAATATAKADQAAAGTFVEQDYADFQISDGVAGQAKEEAEAVFVTPFANVDLSTVDDATVDAVENMRQAAEAAETDKFNPAIDAATGDEADALKIGKGKNKVLKLTGEVQVLNIKIAKAKASGDDTADLEDKLAEEQTKLSKNIATDVKNAGATSKGVV